MLKENCYLTDPEGNLQHRILHFWDDGCCNNCGYIHSSLSYILYLKNRTFAKVVMGKSIPLISGGKIVRTNMAKAFFPLELLLYEMRNIDAPNINEVEAAILETSYHVKSGYDDKWLNALIDSAGELYYFVITEK